MATSIKHQLFFQYPPEAVWEYLTNAELMELWLMKTNFQPVLGSEFTFNIPSVPSLDFDGIVYCKVLEIVPFKKLAYSWKLGPGDGIMNIDSVVSWELRPKNGGTEILLDHGDFVVMKNTALFDAMNKGWLENMQKIPGLLNAENDATASA